MPESKGCRTARKRKEPEKSPEKLEETGKGAKRTKKEPNNSEKCAGRKAGQGQEENRRKAGQGKTRKSQGAPPGLFAPSESVPCKWRRI